MRNVKLPSIPGRVYHDVGKRQGYLGVSIKVDHDIPGTPVTLHYRPSPNELRRLNEGGVIVLELLTFGNPLTPHKLTVDGIDDIE